MSVEATLAELRSSSQGLTEAQARRRLHRYGANIIHIDQRRSWLQLAVGQLANPIMGLLVLAAGATAGLRAWIELFFVLLIIVSNVAVGAWQERKADNITDASAEKASLQSPMAVVLREERRMLVDVKELVVGDIVMLQAGRECPADLRLLHCSHLRMLEASLTGRSAASRKSVDVVAADAPRALRTSMAYMGTLCLHGTATGVVVATGDDTELGQLAHTSRRLRVQQAPLQRQMTKMAQGLSVATVLTAVLVLCLSRFVRHNSWSESVALAISVAVALVPDSFLTVVTITLVVSMTKMAKAHVVVRQLPVVETLGAISCICFDKTGTLTSNDLSATTIFTSRKTYHIHPSADGDYREAKITNESGETLSARQLARLRELLLPAALCNDASMIPTAKGVAAQLLRLEDLNLPRVPVRSRRIRRRRPNVMRASSPRPVRQQRPLRIVSFADEEQGHRVNAGSPPPAAVPARLRSQPLGLHPSKLDEGGDGKGGHENEPEKGTELKPTVFSERSSNRRHPNSRPDAQTISGADEGIDQSRPRRRAGTATKNDDDEDAANINDIEEEDDDADLDLSKAARELPPSYATIWNPSRRMTPRPSFSDLQKLAKAATAHASLHHEAELEPQQPISNLPELSTRTTPLPLMRHSRRVSVDEGHASPHLRLPHSGAPTRPPSPRNAAATFAALFQPPPSTTAGPSAETNALTAVASTVAATSAETPGILASPAVPASDTLGLLARAGPQAKQPLSRLTSPLLKDPAQPDLTTVNGHTSPFPLYFEEVPTSPIDAYARFEVGDTETSSASSASEEENEYSARQQLMALVEQHPELSHWLGSVLSPNAENTGGDGDLGPRVGPARWRAIGDATDMALLNASMIAGINYRTIHVLQRWAPRRASMPFSPALRFMATVHDFPTSASAQPGHRRLLLVKGALDTLLPHCRTQAVGLNPWTTEPIDRQKWLDLHESLTKQGYRVLALCVRDFRAAPAAREGGAHTSAMQRASAQDSDDAIALEAASILAEPPSLQLNALVALEHRVRPEVGQAVTILQKAGVTVKMLTGDQPDTAMAVASRIHIAATQVLIGPQMTAMEDDELGQRLLEANVLALARPELKVRVIRNLQSRNLLVAMAGDGVNDALALRQADVGVALGLAGTDLAVRSSRVILRRDSLLALAEAVKIGRTTYDNVQKVLVFLLPTTVGQAMSVVAALVVDQPPPLTGVQVLLINMVTASSLGFVLASEEPEDRVMQVPPRPANQPLLTWFVLLRTVWVASAFAAVVLGQYTWTRHRDGSDRQSYTVAVNSFISAECAYLICCRYFTDPSLRPVALFGNRWALSMILLNVALQMFVSYTPGLNEALQLDGLGIIDWLTVWLMGVAFFFAVECEKYFWRLWRSGTRARCAHGRRPGGCCPVKMGPQLVASSGTAVPSEQQPMMTMEELHVSGGSSDDGNNHISGGAISVSGARAEVTHPVLVTMDQSTDTLLPRPSHTTFRSLALPEQESFV